MKSAKIFFGLAVVALLGAVGCVMAFVFAPEPVPVADEKPQEDTVVEESNENNEKTEEILNEEAAKEVARFLDKYDMVIPHEEMLEQVKIRYDYEKKYGSTYAMEEIFLVDVPEDDSVGDPGDDTLEKIQRYVEMYNVDESRYASMTAQEELDALEVEYGPLPDEEIVDSQEMDGSGVQEESMTVAQPIADVPEEGAAETEQEISDEQNERITNESTNDTPGEAQEVAE